MLENLAPSNAIVYNVLIQTLPADSQDPVTNLRWQNMGAIRARATPSGLACSQWGGEASRAQGGGAATCRPV